MTENSNLGSELNTENIIKISCLDLSEKEKKHFVKEFKKDEKVEDRSVSDNFQFPDKEDAILSLMTFYPQHFETNRLEKVAIEIPEYAPELIGEITKRGGYRNVLEVLDRLSDTPNFEYCVRSIEKTLDKNPKRDDILEFLSLSLGLDEMGEKASLERFSEHMLSKPEGAARDLSKYLKLLRLDEARVKQLLNNKKLLLIGGGTAPIKKQLSDMGIHCDVTNIEPLLDDRNSRDNSDYPIPENFYNADLLTLGKFNEVWAANNSLPTYALNPEQVTIFYQKSLGFVQQGGVLRVLPMSGFNDSITPAMRLNRIPTNNESVKIIRELEEHPELFTVERFETTPLKSFVGRKKKMNGVNIKMVGNDEQVRMFLDKLAKK